MKIRYKVSHLQQLPVTVMTVYSFEDCVFSPSHIKAERGAKRALRPSLRTKPTTVAADLGQPQQPCFCRPASFRTAVFLLPRRPSHPHPARQLPIGTRTYGHSAGPHGPSKGLELPSSSRQGCRRNQSVFLGEQVQEGQATAPSSALPGVGRLVPRRAARPRGEPTLRREKPRTDAQCVVSRGSPLPLSFGEQWLGL